MRRTALIILGVAGGLVALVLIAVAIAVATVDVDSFAEPLAARVSAATGRPFKIGGPLSLHVSLEPTLRADNVTLGNAPWGQGPDMMTIGRLEAQVALLPLLHRRFEIVRVTLVDPVITLETDKTGRGNWAFGEPGTSATPPAGAASAAAPALGVGEVEIRNGTLNYRDGATGKVTPVTIETLTLHTRDANAPITGEFRGTIDGVPVAVKGNVGSRAALAAQQWPWPIDIKGEVAGRSATLATKLTAAQTTTKLDDLALAFGDLVLQGSVAVDRSGARPRYVVDLSMPRFAPEALALPAVAAGKAAVSKPAPVPAPASHHLIPDQPIPLGVLRDVDAEGHVAIGTLALAHGQALERVDLRFKLNGGRLDITDLTAAGLGGTVAVRGTVQARDATSPALDLHVEGRDLELKPLLALAGSPRDVSGGKTRVTLDAKASGASPHGWASTMDGTAVILVGPAQLHNASGASTAMLDKVGEAVNPFRKAQSATELRCAVVRLPIRDGVARVDRTIAAETGELGVSASGTIDFRNETLDLTLKPQVRQGIPINVTGLADIVRVRGPFDSPQLSVDPVKSAESVARIGAAIGTGGWSLLGEALLDNTASADSPCAIAMGAKPSPQAASPNAAQKPPVPAEIGRALNKLLGR
jgi:uncharacterized protein involved in outer membrane biogenesis